MNIVSKYLLIAFLLLATVSCKKLIEIDPPIDTITTEQVFESNQQAEWAVAGIYSRMINGGVIGVIPTLDCFYAGLSNIAASLSSDELINSTGSLHVEQHVLVTNSLNGLNSTLSEKIWKSAYKTIYDANAVVEGIEASQSKRLTDSVRKQLTGEAKALRAFAYFYLTNFFGDLPLVLSLDYNETKNLPRSSQSVIYEQIVKDLTSAKELLAADFSVSKMERIRINKWFAEALLSRVYLYTGKYEEAIASATAVINSDLFDLEEDLNNVFLMNNQEAIWQLAQSPDYFGTPEGLTLVPMASVGEGHPAYHYNESFINQFENDDKRRQNWIGRFENPTTGEVLHYPFKYKMGRESWSYTEYYTVMRLAELYLIRAEARTLHTSPNIHGAITDLNELRQRADIDDYPLTLTAAEVIDAVAKERRMELFTEGAHRWFDLKRTGKASSVLSAVSYKKPWRGDYQLLYPVPPSEIETNIKLSQNPQYNNF